MIPYGKHKIFPSDIDAVTKVLDGGFLTQGEQVPLFEQAVCDYTGAKYAVACNSGTSGLHIACLALDISKNDIEILEIENFIKQNQAEKVVVPKINLENIEKYQMGKLTMRNIHEIKKWVGSY